MKLRSSICLVFFCVASLGASADHGADVPDVEVDRETRRVRSLISGRPVSEIAVAGRLYIDLHAHFMAARTEDTGHVLNWYNLGYSGGDGSSGEQGGTFGNFGLDVPWQERTRHYPLWSPVEDVPSIRFSGGQFIKADFPYTHVGHNAVFRGPDGRWWIVCHAQRKDNPQEMMLIDPFWFDDAGNIRTHAPTYTPQEVPIDPEILRRFPGLAK